MAGVVRRHGPENPLVDEDANAPLIVGSADDIHVQAVVDALRDGGVVPVLIDAATLEQEDTTGPAWSTERASQDLAQRRGWIRRLAPPGWRTPTQLGTHDAAQRIAWATLLSGILVTEPCLWLTPLPALLSAENKLFQLALANRCGIRVPRTAVATSLDQLHGLGDVVVAKPLGPSHYTDDDGVERIVAAQRIDRAALTDSHLRAAPFLFQEELQAAAHLRVVTVGTRCWAARLEAVGLPLDWRFDDAAHHSFYAASAPLIEKQAVLLAAAAGVGYTSQDWIVTTDRSCVFLDLNPAGQWLFLPREVAEAVTRAIAAHLGAQR